MKYWAIFLLLFASVPLYTAQPKNEGPVVLPHSLEHYVNEGSTRMVIAYLLSGADPNSTSSTQSTPIIFSAIQRGFFDIVRALVTWNVRLDTHDLQGRTPLDFARTCFANASDKNKALYSSIEKYIRSVMKQPPH